MPSVEKIACERRTGLTLSVEGAIATLTPPELGSGIGFQIICCEAGGCGSSATAHVATAAAPPVATASATASQAALRRGRWPTKACDRFMVRSPPCLLPALGSTAFSLGTRGSKRFNSMQWPKRPQRAQCVHLAADFDLDDRIGGTVGWN